MITAGTAINEAFEIIGNEKVKLLVVSLLLDRQETTATDPTKSATQAVSENTKFQFYQLLIWVKL